LKVGLEVAAYLLCRSGRAEMTERGPFGDREKPRRESVSRLVTVDVLVGLHKRILSQVLCVVAIAGQTEQEIENSAFELSHQLLKSRPAARLALFGELFRAGVLLIRQGHTAVVSRGNRVFHVRQFHLHSRGRFAIWDKLVESVKWAKSLKALKRYKRRTVISL